MCPGFAEALQTLFNVWVDEVQSTFSVTGQSNEDCIGDTSFNVTGPSGRPSRPSSSTGTLTAGDSDEAVATALDLLREADDALATGDLGRYQELVNQARDLLASVDDGLASADSEDESADSAEDGDSEDDADEEEGESA